MEKSPFYNPPEHFSEQQAQLFLSTARALLPQREPSILSFEDPDLPEHLVFYATSTFMVDDSFITIAETELESEDDSTVSVKITTPIGEAGVEERHYEFYPATGYSMYRLKFKSANRHNQYEGLSEEESFTLAESNLERRRRFLVDSVLQGIYDFTQEKMDEVLEVLSRCSVSNQIS